MPFDNLGQLRQGAKFANNLTLEDRANESKERLRSNLASHYNKRYSPQIEKKRTTFSAVLDLLSTGSYASAGFASGLVNKDENPVENMFKGIGAGFTGNDEHSYTYSRVIGDMGWNPTSTKGKVAKGAIGLVGDIFLDPATYLSGFGTALLKGSGKGAKVTHGMTKAMKLEDAVPIVKSFVKSKGIKVTKSEIDDMGAKLARTMNAKGGFAKNSTPLSLRLDMAPFGKKIFGKYSDKGIDLVSAETMEKIGDSTFAPIYSAVRDTFYGSRMGELFSTSSLAYKASKESPEKLLEIIAPKMRKDMLKLESREAFDVFKKRGDDLGFDPATTKEIFDALEDPSVWNKVRKMVTLKDIDESGKYAGRVQRKFGEANRTMEDLKENLVDAKKTKDEVSESLIKGKQEVTQLKREMSELKKSGAPKNREQYRALESEYRNARNKVKKAKRRLDNQNKHLKEYYNEIERLEKFDATKHNMTESQQQEIWAIEDGITDEEFTLRGLDVEATDIKNEYKKKRISIAKKVEDFKVGKAEKTQKLTGKSKFGETVDSFTPDGVELSTQRKASIQRKITDVRRDKDGRQFITYADSRGAKSLSEATGWEYRKTNGGKYAVYLPDEVVSNANSISKTPAKTIQKMEIIGDMGDYAYGDISRLREDIPDKEFDELYAMIKQEAQPEDVRAYIEANGLMRREDQKMYSYVAKQLGYNDYHEEVSGQIRKLRELRGKEGLNKEQLRRLDELEIMERKRKYMIDSLRKLDVEERNEFMTAYEDGMFADSIDSNIAKKRDFESLSNYQADFRQTKDFRDNKSYNVVKTDVGSANPRYSPYRKTPTEARYEKAEHLNSDELKDLWGRRKKRWGRIEKELKSGQVEQAKRIKKQVWDEINNLKKVDPDATKQLEELKKSGAKHSEKMKVLHDKKMKKIEIRKRMNDKLETLENHYEKSMKGYIDDPRTVNTVEDAYRREVSQKLDANKGALITDLHTEMAKVYPDMKVDPSLLTENDVAFLEEAYEVFRKKVYYGSNNLPIDLDNLTNDQYKKLLDDSLEKVVKDIGGKKIKLGKGDKKLKEIIKGKTTIQDVVQEMTEKRAKLKKNLTPTMEEKLRSISKSKSMAQERIVKANEKIEELYRLNAEDAIVKAEKDIADYQNRIKQLKPDVRKTEAEKLKLQEDVKVKAKALGEAKEAREQMSRLNKRLHQAERNIDQLETYGKEYSKKITADTEEYGKAVKQFEALEEIVNDDRRLSEYIMDTSNRVISDGEKAELLAKYETTEYILKSDVPMTDRVREATNMIRKDLQKMGMEEVQINKLTSDQFENMIQGYLPHVVTDEGRAFFNSKADAVEHIKGFGDTFGFGKVFNPHGKSRTVKVLKDVDGNIIKENPTIREINKHFAEQFPELKGKNIFSENIQEIYLSRAKKHVDLMYDNKYMDEVTEIFGEPYEAWTKTGAGKMQTANIGRFRQDASNHAKIERQMLIDDAIQEYIENEKFVRFDANTGEELTLSLVDDISRVVEEMNVRHLKKTGEYMTDKMKKRRFGKLMQSRIKKFTEKKFPKSMRREMVEENIEKFLSKTGTEGYLDDLSMPFLELDNNQSDTILDSIRELKEKRLDQIKAGSKGWVRITDEATGEVTKLPKKKGMVGFLSSLRNGELPKGKLKEIADADVGQLRKIMEEHIPYMDDMDYKRYQGYVKKLDTMEDLKNDTIRSVPQGLTERFNNGRKLQIQRDNSDMLNLWDKFTKLIKLNQTTVLPNFHMKSKFGNTMANLLGVGNDAVSPRFQKLTYDIVKNKGNVPGGMNITRLDGSTEFLTNKQIWNMADDMGVTSGGWFAFDGNPGSNMASKLGLKSKYNPLDEHNFFLYQMGGDFGKKIEDQDRILHFMSKLKGGADIHESASSVEKFLFDYGDLTFFEQSTMKRIIPYYTWMRKNIPLQLEMLLEKPDIYRNVAKMYHGIEGMSAEEDVQDSRFVDDFAQDWIQLPFQVTNPDGRKENVMFNPNLPFMDLSSIPNIFNPVESAKDLINRMNPMIVQPIEQAFNKNLFFDSEIVREGDENPFGSVATRIDHTLRQSVLYNFTKGMVQKDGSDLALHAWNNMTGIKFLSYDYNMYRAQRLEEASNMTNQEYFDMMSERRWSYRKQQPLFAVAHGYPSAMSRAMHGITNYVDSTKPTPAGMYDGALRPISQQSYNELSEEEQNNYTPPDNETAWAYHKKAVELEKEAYDETRAPVRFVWGLFDVVGSRSENQGKYEVGRVNNVVDGDTFDMDVGGENKRVRMLLVDTPELSGDEAYAEEASEYADKSLMNKDVRVIMDGSATDHYGRTLGYVELPGEGVDFNRELLERGYALTNYVFEPPYTRLKNYTRTELDAKKQGIRLHGE